MWKNIVLPVLCILCAITVSGSAAFFSVYGLSKLFAGASLAVIVMASALEISKLAIVSLLHQYWIILPRLLKVYFSIAVFILIVITSMGIYGFLSNAYEKTALQNATVEKEVSILDLKKNNYQERVDEYSAEREGINTDIGELRKALSQGTTVQYVDKETGQLVTTSSRSVRQSFENQLNDAIERRDESIRQIEALNDSIVSIELQILEKNIDNEAAAELGPLIYLNRLTGVPMDNIINWLLIIIVFVFDPLAVCLVLAVNYIFSTKLIKKSVAEESGKENVKLKVKVEENPLPPSTETSEKEEIVHSQDKVDIFDDLYDEKSSKEVANPEKSSDIKNKVVLTPQQRRNMSHQQVKSFEQNND